ncbi:MAG: MFS transporter [Rhodospirillaceae bacterium]|jgi:MFS transporter, UMF1 family|nr:MFS transporter [Rhodospirillaceae bacterium]MBT6510958.1 MFS transporter [Rhodospirillaceae bacterium]MBT7614324.1 MFS transporter [Rhodospirillaceae bacterium]MBT7645742.1 MFS transporter [Rhodospirillaceae bacterium]
MTTAELDRPVTKRGLAAWCLFDWANSPTPTVVVTFVFAPYFARGIVGNEAEGLALWSWGIAFSALVIAVLAPVTGAIADAAGRRKPWIAGFSLLTILATAGLWFCAPDPTWIFPTLILVALVNIGFETSTVFYNAMLPDLADAKRVGRISGWAWGMGYGGGLACLIVALLVFIMADPAPFGLDPGQSEPVRAVALLVALWFIVFGWPMFVWSPDRPSANVAFGVSARRGMRRLVETARELGQHRIIVRFLIARLLYIDGLNTLFALGGLYAASTFGMDEKSVLIFAIALNATAGLGAVGFAWMDDKVGARTTLTWTLGCLMIVSTAILLVQSALWFWILGIVLGTFIGPVQSASRSLMARLAPPAMTGEMFGFFALSGKLTSFAGPLLVGLVAYATDSQRLGMGVIVVLMAIGLIILRTVPEPEKG